MTVTYPATRAVKSLENCSIWGTEGRQGVSLMALSIYGHLFNFTREIDK